MKQEITSTQYCFRITTITFSFVKVFNEDDMKCGELMAQCYNSLILIMTQFKQAKLQLLITEQVQTTQGPLFIR